jgi:uncharacterized protein
MIQENPDLAGRLERTLAKSDTITEIIKRVPELEIPNWYLVAGCVAQTVWNELHGFPLASNIRDYDLVYYDNLDLSYEAEDQIIKRASSVFSCISALVEVRNEARVHLWYEKRFGHPIVQYNSVEDAISSFHCTATTIGIKSDGNGRFRFYAPFGLDDLFSLVIRPNKRQARKEIYTEKAERWKKIWPNLNVIPY